MTAEDFPEFDAAFTDMMDVLSAGKHEPSARISGLWARVLAPYPLAAVLAGMEAHMRAPDTGRTLPIPADIIKAINAAVANDGRPGADEAWAIAVQSVDEGSTVVWTEEIAQAWGLSKTVMALGDEVGARVAFRDAYNRMVHDARCARRPMAWQVALGTDRARQMDALRVAASLGRVSADVVGDMQALPAPRAPVLLLAGASAPSAGEPNEAQRKAMQALRAALSAKDEAPSADLLDRQRTAQLRITAAEKVAAYATKNENAA